MYKPNRSVMRNSALYVVGSADVSAPALSCLRPDPMNFNLSFSMGRFPDFTDAFRDLDRIARFNMVALAFAIDISEREDLASVEGERLSASVETFEFPMMSRQIPATWEIIGWRNLELDGRAELKRAPSICEWSNGWEKLKESEWARSQAPGHPWTECMEVYFEKRRDGTCTLMEMILEGTDYTGDAPRVEIVCTCVRTVGVEELHPTPRTQRALLPTP